MSKELFFQAIQAIVQPSQLIYDRQNAPRPTKPYVTLRVRAIDHPTNAVVHSMDGYGEATMVEQVMFRMDLNFFGKGAMAAASRASSLFRYHTQIQAAHELGLAYSTTTPPTDLSLLLGNQFEERAMIEVNGYAIASGLDLLGLIESVEIEGTLQFGDDEAVYEFIVALPQPPPEPAWGQPILLEDGTPLLDEDGNILLQEDQPVFHGGILLETGFPLLTESGAFLLQEA